MSLRQENIKEFTEVWILVSHSDGSKEYRDRVWYKDYPDFNSLPSICKTEEIRQEHAAFWASQGAA